MNPTLHGIVQALECVVLFCFLALISAGWGALCCERIKAPARFQFMLGFAVLSLLAYALFYIFLLDAITGRVVTCLVGLVSIGVTVHQRKKLKHVDFWLPLFLFFLYAASCLLILVLHGSNPNHSVSHDLPVDNILPQALADRLWHGGDVMPFHGITVVRVDHLLFFGDWLSSDRPPLQVGLSLLFFPFEYVNFEQGELYQIVSTLLQVTWLPSVYLLARQLRFSRYAIGLMLVWFAGSGFFLVHTIFTWPKLLAASLFLAGLSLLLFCVDELPKKNGYTTILIGLLWGLASLAHGGILFSLLAIPFFPAGWRLLKINPRAVFAAFTVFVLVGLPWSAYKKFYDPPGDRLIKWHMAGVENIDARSSWQTIRDSYGKLTFTEWLQRREDNVETTILWDKTDSVQSVQALQTYLNRQGFFRLSAVVGLLGLGYIVWLVEWFRKTSLIRKANPHLIGLLGMNLAAYVIWSTLMFEPFSTVVHQGSYGMVILFMVMGAFGVARLPQWAGLSLLACQWFLFGFAWLFFLPVPVDIDAAWIGGMILYCAMMVLFAASLWLFLPRTEND